MGLTELNTQYTTLKASYDRLVAQALANPGRIAVILPQIQTINQEMATVLSQMLTELQYARESSNSDAYRTQLIETLTRIQSDYNGLKTNTDALQTLRRIRSFQDTSWKSTLTMYLALFLVVGILLALVVLFRRQTKVSTIAPTMSPTAMPPLM
jgi:hypothetical protein